MQKVNIKLEVFEGPFDLLFHLIEKNEIDIYDIPIRELAEQYLEYINNLNDIDLDNISEFLLMAATLLEIKSKMLLPKIKEIKYDEIDPREDLVRRLIEYKKYKKAAELFKEKDVFIDTVFFKEQEKELIEYLIDDKLYKIEDILEDVTLQSLYCVFQDVLRRKELKVDKIRSSFRTINKDIFTISRQIMYIKDLLNLHNEISFTDIFTIESPKLEVIVSFLAILEMIKLNEIKIFQEKTFDEIVIVRNEQNDF